MQKSDLVLIRAMKNKQELITQEEFEKYGIENATFEQIDLAILCQVGKLLEATECDWSWTKSDNSGNKGNVLDILVKLWHLALMKTSDMLLAIYSDFSQECFDKQFDKFSKDVNYSATSYRA